MEDAHMTTWLYENLTSPIERGWLKWVPAVEALLGHDLDGDQRVDGYSMDYAFELFESGLTPAEAAAKIERDKAVTYILTELL